MTPTAPRLPATADERPDAGPWPWFVAVLGWLYYQTPLVKALLDGSDAVPQLAVLLVGVGLLGVLALGLRRRTPLATVLLLAVLWAFSPAVIGAAAAAQAHLARRRPLPVALGAGSALLAGKLVDSGWALSRGAALGPVTFELWLAVAFVSVATLIGLLGSSRSQARRNAADAEAARHEAEQARLAEARLAERERIAREMHDVVAHRLSLIALHAGALAYRTTLDLDEAREAARLVQLNARTSLDELRAMLATLRGTQAAPEPPQPSLDQLAVLLADAEDAGQDVNLTTTGDLTSVPARVSRQAFRIVQECLTNARKHAPGAPVALSVARTDDRLVLRAANPLADLAGDTAGAGLGLIGVVERVALVGGTVAHGVRGGEFVVDAVLPVGVAEPEERP